jgi:predicted CXXCH cytochrome family protein
MPSATANAAEDHERRIEYVGSERCGACHEAAATAWKSSHHALAMQLPSPEAMRGDFADKVFRYFGESTRFRRRLDHYEVETIGVSRESGGIRIGKQSYEIKYAFGVEPLQQYLVDIGGGYLQALPFAYDTRAKEEGRGRWFHLHPKEHVKVGDELHWTATSYNWNKNCADCHSTDVHKNYDSVADRYDTRYGEISVGCEACHGPASRHVEQAERHRFDADKGWARRFAAQRDRFWEFREGKPIAQLAGSLDAGQGARVDEVDACAPCHARRSDTGGDSSALHDRYRVELLESDAYFADGQVRDEVFEYGSFVQSKMYRAGVVCSDCHEPHAGSLRAPGNSLCTRCHSSTRYDTPRHHLHREGTPGSECVQCHMPSRTFMEIDERRDHRLGLPRPDLSLELGVPNACTTACHAKKPAPDRRSADAWAKIIIEQNFGSERPKTFARALHAARGLQLGAADQLLEVTRDASFPPIARATALLELRAYPDAIEPSLAVHAKDPNPLVRRALAELAESAPDPHVQTALARPALSDAARTVRLGAVRALLDVPRDAWPTSDRKAFERARSELRSSLEFNADRPEVWLDLARLRLAEGPTDEVATAKEVEAMLRRAIALDPALAAGYIALADFLRTRDRDREALELLTRGIEKCRDRAPLEHALGLAYVRLGERREGLEHLRRAHEAAPDSSRLGYVYAMGLYETGDRKAAIALLERLHTRFEGDLEITKLLAAYREASRRRDDHGSTP